MLLPSVNLSLAESVNVSAISGLIFHSVSAKQVGLHRRRLHFTCAGEFNYRDNDDDDDDDYHYY